MPCAQSEPVAIDTLQITLGSHTNVREPEP